MKKIAVLTLYGNSNFGNKLQEYAVKKFCENLGYETYTIKNYSEIREYSNIFIAKIFNCFKSIKKILQGNKNFKNDNYMYFNKNFLREDKRFFYSNQNNCKLEKKYDFFIVGSDQVWNPKFGLRGDLKFLECAGSKRKIAFSASFGVSLLEDDIDEYKKGLSNIDYLSVREDAGKKIIQDLTGRNDVSVLVDPTMLLTKEEWKMVSRKPKNMTNKKYILNYFLGRMSDNIRNEIYSLAKKNNWEVINILDKADPFYNIGPSEFIYLEEHAELICTDSFHSSVFGILMNTPFVVFDRDDNIESMNSRLDTLLNKFDLKSRKFNGKLEKKFLSCDFSHCYDILKSERNKSREFLLNALDVGDENNAN